MAKKQMNGYLKAIVAGIAVAGIIWNAAILHNEVKHLKDDMSEIKQSIKAIETVFFARETK